MTELLATDPLAPALVALAEEAERATISVKPDEGRAGCRGG